uniref:Reverse transcriptase domain-containing protein n=1 Tax=Tanacetum cinerariifolium TaxID=118510 RepID=A0A6L2JY36_TANCI|nr:reverse transcriptase domain-containing protein [Tanacetum cinerariifolium]
MKMNTASSSSSGTLPGNTITNPKEDLKGITTRSGTAYQGPTIPNTSSSPVVDREIEATKDTMHPTNNRSIEYVQPLVVPIESLILNSELVNSPIIDPVAFPVSAPKPNQRPSIPYPSRLQDQKLRDPSKFLIPCDFPGMAECLALADLGSSINLMPLFVWNKLSLPDLSPTCMTLELADRLISRPVGVAEDVFVKVGTFHFLADFVVVDFDADPRVPLILERFFLKTERALIDVFKEYSKEVLGFSDVIASGNPTSYYDPIVSTTSLTLTPFGNSDFLLEEVDAFLALEDDPTSPEVDQSYLNSKGDILLLEAFLNDDPSLPPPNQGNYLPKVRKELKICEAKSDKSSINEPPEVELKDLPPYLEYVFLEGDDKLPVIIAKDLSVEEKTVDHTLLKYLTMLIHKKKQKSRRKQRKEIEVPSPSSEIPTEERLPTTFNDPLPSGEDRMQLNELMILCTNLLKQVLDLEEAKTTQAKEIASLKKRVKKIEQKRKSRTLGLKRLRKGRMNEKDMFGVNDLDGDEVVMDVSASEKVDQSVKVVENEVSNIDPITTAGEEVTTAGIEVTTAATTPQISKDELTLA